MSAEAQQQDQERSLYRRHRPRTFADVVGQEPVVRTLRNAVERGKVHHAYLFVGSRGTGKTSMAKILAACLNCDRDPAQPTIEPCGRCESCLSIAGATSLDVIEMDAASNNSVDDIRELRESVAYAPVSGRRKVYILDEAHMLSTAAWNAFLKTLEEPPPNTVFVLATTEANKVPPTVVDRCHRFDFHRPTVEQIVSVLRRAAEAESITIPPPALAAVARSATGSFRDALGTLEQLITYSGSEILLEDVLAVLGVADAGLLSQTVAAVAAGDARAALGAMERCAESGRDAASFASDLEVRARELLIVQTLGEVPEELALTPEADAALAEQAAAIDHATVVRLLELLGDAMEAVRAGADARTRLELALVKAARPQVDSSMRALLTRIERLEREQGGVSAVAPNRELPVPRAAEQSPPGAPASAAEVSAPESPRPAPLESPAPAPTEPSAAGPRPAPAPPQAAAPDPAGTPQPEAAPAPEPGAAPEVVPAPQAAPAPHPEAVPGPEVVPAPERGAAPEPAAATTQVAPERALAGDLVSMGSLWPAVVDLVRSENALLGALIAEARPVDLRAEELTLAFASPFLKKKAEDPSNRMTVGEALRVVTGSRWQLTYELREGLAAEQPGPEGGEHSEERWLARFMEEFDAEEVPGEWSDDAAEPAEKGV